MTSPQTELDNAIERLSDDFDDVLDLIGKIIDHHKSKEQRVKELEAQSTQWAGDAGKWAAECDKLNEDLSTLRTEYKKVLEALNNTVACTYCELFYERNNMLRSALFNACECCSCADVRNSKELLSSPFAIAVMKGEV